MKDKKELASIESTYQQYTTGIFIYRVKSVWYIFNEAEELLGSFKVEEKPIEFIKSAIGLELERRERYIKNTQTKGN